MEINELFRKLDKGGYSSTLTQLKNAFFNKIGEEFFLHNFLPNYVKKHKGVTWKRFPTEILRQFPDAKLYYDENQNLDRISLSNADFKIWVRRLSFPEFAYQLDIEGKNVIDFMEQVNNLLPEWNAEFLQLCRENAKRIEEFELKRLMYGHNQNIVQKYIISKIEDLCLMQRKDFSFYKKELSLQWRKRNLGKSEKKTYNYGAWSWKNIYQYRLKNMSVELQFYQGYMILDINGLTFTKEFDLGYLPMIVQIDEHLPQWLDEAVRLKHEYEKKEKTEQIATNTSIIVVKNKMKEYGYEYHYNHTKGELEIKLEKKRKLVVTLPIINMEKLKEKLDALPTYVEAINNVPMNYRIHFQTVGNVTWENEENS